MLASKTAAEGDWLIARAQEAGRGRQGREWRSLKGNFFGSTLVKLRPDDPPPQTLSLGAGVALIEAVEAVAPNPALMLKWPNDLLLDGLKLAGILLERNGERVVIGFGVNLAAAPHLADRQTASLDGAVTPDDFAPLLAESFARMLVLWRSGDPSAAAQAWLAQAHPIGSELTAHVTPDERITGTFDGLEADGALRLRTADGVQIVRAGDVSL